MRIDAFNKISQLYNSSNVKNTVKTKGSSFNDKLEISQLGKDYQVAKQIIAQTPDVREDKINEIKKRMEASSYQVSIKDVADKLAEKYFEEQ